MLPTKVHLYRASICTKCNLRRGLTFDLTILEDSTAPMEVAPDLAEGRGMGKQNYVSEGGNIGFFADIPSSKNTNTTK